MIAVLDDAGRAVALARPAQRIVSLVPSLTEALFALGRGEALVGVTRYCTEPAGEVERIERVGGTKNPDLERISVLQPDLVVVNAEENRKEDFDALARVGMSVFVSFSHRVRDVPALLERLGALTGGLAAAGRLANDLNATLDAMELPHTFRRPRVFCPIWKNPWMGFNRDTYADDMLWSAGGDNVCRDHTDRYPTVTLEGIAATAPEVILLPDEPYVFREKDLPSLGSLTGTPAYRTQQIHFIDGKALSWYGPRSSRALRDLRRLLVDCPPHRLTD